MMRNKFKTIGLFLLAACVLTRAFAQPVATGHDAHDHAAHQHATHQSTGEKPKPVSHDHAQQQGKEDKKDAASHNHKSHDHKTACCQQAGHDGDSHKKTDTSKESRCKMQCDMTSAPALPSSDKPQSGPPHTSHCAQSSPQLKGKTCTPEQKPPIR